MNGLAYYEHDEIDIHPKFQRYYRWSLEHKSRLIGSILLGMSILPIFVSQRKDGDTVGLERLFLELSWNHYNRLGEGHYFNFLAVVLYVLTWHLAARWARYNGTAADKRFDDMVEHALGDFKDMYR